MNSKLYKGDCLKLMGELPDKSVDMILCDLPYGTTACKWDKNLDSVKMWSQYQRIIKDNGAIVLFASGGFTNKLINSNPEIYRYKWIWIKNKKGNFVNAKNRPMTSYEEICIFSKGVTANGKTLKMKYNPQGLVQLNKVMKNGESKFGTVAGKRPSHKTETLREFTNYPFDVLQFDCEPKPIHPTQKPIALLEYLVKTYTNENEIVLDNCMGSGSTGIACLNTNRNFIGIELDDCYYNVAVDRVKKHIEDNNIKNIELNIK